MWIGWSPNLEEAGPMLARAARPGDVAMTMGAGNVDDAAPTILDRLGE
jgi:UDP-N-acetylmuramate-alanine ligase